ncbi:MAG: energy-coupling factor transporter ATPase [Anaerolineae bacterium]|nr:energy-coupling factor transporter ATPase [Anaerolineae bacterium]MDW8099956.1 energy-coupling factor transporter ATPase [Anaerolineae bacterium]
MLRGVHLRARRGELIVLLGRTGAGKTTLCLSTNGLVPHATGGTIRGSVEVCGQDTRRLPPAALASAVGMVFQDAESQLFQMTVEDEIAFGLENLGFPPEEIERRITWALSVVGIEPLRHRSPRRLSGGQMQRVAIAAALALRPALLVLDEPTSHLDPRGKIEVLTAIQQLRAELDTTILMAAQDIEWVVPLADGIAVLVDGLVRSLPLSSLSIHEASWLLETGVGAPQTTRLVHALLSRNNGQQGHLPLSLQETARVLTPARWRVLPPRPRASPMTIFSSPIITIEDLDFVYPNGTRAISGISVQIGAGEYVALVGPNGAGKSTLARLLMGLLRPTAGRVVVNGLDTRLTRVPVLARHVGYAFQNPDHQIFAPTVYEELAFGPRNAGWTADQVDVAVQEMLTRFELGHLARVPPAVLGYGLRRKIAVAAVAISRPAVFILDEPTGGLDRASAQELLDFLDELNRQGVTIILITHDMTIVAERARRCIVLVDGRITFDGSPRELFARPDVLEHAGLLPPPITRLAEALGVPREIAPILSVDEFLEAWAGEVAL